MDQIRTPSVGAARQDTAIVYVVDDDEELCAALVELFRSVSIEARCFSSSRAFLASTPLSEHGCILLDVRLPGLNGLELQQHLDRIGNRMPIVFMTGYGDIPMTVRALKAGASDFLEKPFRQQALLDAVSDALAKNQARLAGSHEVERLRELAAKLTPREAEVMKAVVSGLMNKQIAYHLGIKEITVKLHRGAVMRKMEVASLAELVRRAALIAD